MRRLAARIIVALVIGIASSSTAHALNFCFNPGSTVRPSLAVAERFKRPARNSCSPINGFDLSATPGPRLVTGTACLNAAGDTLRVAYTLESFRVSPGLTSPNDPLFVQMILPYPSLVGGSGSVVEIGVGDEYTATGAHANACIPPSPTIP